MMDGAMSAKAALQELECTAVAWAAAGRENRSAIALEGALDALAFCQHQVADTLVKQRQPELRIKLRDLYDALEAAREVLLMPPMHDERFHQD